MMLTQERITEMRRTAPGDDDAADQLSDALDEVERLRAALESIAKDPHQAYGEHGGYHATSDFQSQYNLGCADGHRCVASAARRALGWAVDS